MQVGVVGINHKLADLQLRELLAKACQRRFGPENSMHADHTFVLLSTCNRTEVYFTSHDLAVTHTYLLGILRQEVSEEFEHKLYSYFGSDCFTHLSRVTAGLDSAIVAETEIHGQVKNAYEAAVTYTTLPSDLHYLFQKSLHLAKQVRSQLYMTRGMPDLEHAILQIGSDHFKQPKKAKILFVGVSEINQKILAFFRSKGIDNITLCNRTKEHAETCAQQYQTETLVWDKFTCWHEYDWIIFGTKSSEYLLNKKDIPSHVQGNKLIIDLCVPRNVEPSLKKEKGITLLNIDQINRSLKVRKKNMTHLLSKAEKMISESSRKQTNLFLEKERNRKLLSQDYNYAFVGA